MNINELIARWDSNDGKPYKGSLIDFAAYEPGNLSCMCAQGQVLHVIGGKSADWLRAADQVEADRETAALLNISRVHAILLRRVNDSIDGAPSIVLNDPGAVLGDQWSELLDFWWAMDQMDAAAWVAAWVAAWDAAWDAARDPARDAARAAARDAAWAAAWVAAWDAAWDAARDPARDAARAAARDAAWAAARDAAWDAAWDAARDPARDAAGAAAWEIQGAEIFRRANRPFYFLPLFGFQTPDDIPARPADYGAAPIKEKG